MSDRWLKMSLISAILTLAIVASVPVRAYGQTQPAVPSQSSTPPGTDDAGSPAVKPPDHHVEGKIAESEVSQTKPVDEKEQSRAKLLADTHRLILLSRQLQTEIVSNKQDTLSLALIKKVEELQRLAATVKAEMEKAP